MIENANIRSICAKQFLVRIDVHGNARLSNAIRATYRKAFTTRFTLVFSLATSWITKRS